MRVGFFFRSLKPALEEASYAACWVAFSDAGLAGVDFAVAFFAAVFFAAAFLAGRFAAGFPAGLVVDFLAGMGSGWDRDFSRLWDLKA
ncbi:hypothetical protein [Luteolibacter sp. Populi]|uniref:hypothetical protein n=1 Tax=Luteolibacter sp. Populi TaxID=3230487 RepID=UPI003467DD11